MSSRPFQAVLFVVGLCALVTTGCTTTRYQPNSPVTAAKSPGYPVPVYTPEMTIPRPTELIGTASILAGKFTLIGGGSDAEFVKLMRLAREKGADVVRMKYIRKPSFANPNYSLTAELLRYADQWETVPVTKFQFQAYLDRNRQNLDPIEGVWYGDLPRAHSIAIMRNGSKPGREFVGFLLADHLASWPNGMKKMDISHGPEPGSYVLTYYLDDFTPRDVHIILGQKHTFDFNLPKDDKNFIITYTKY